MDASRQGRGSLRGGITHKCITYTCRICCYFNYCIVLWSIQTLFAEYISNMTVLSNISYAIECPLHVHLYRFIDWERVKVGVEAKDLSW